MNEENRDLLENEIKTLFENLEDLNPFNEDYGVGTDNLVKLYKLKIEEDKIEDERLKKEKEETLNNVQLRENVKDRYLKVGIAAAELIIPLVFYGVWMRKGFKFEEEGTFTSTTFRNLFSRFKPTKK